MGWTPAEIAVSAFIFLIFVLAVAALTVWFRRRHAAESAIRMMRMMLRVGVDPVATVKRPSHLIHFRHAMRRCVACWDKHHCDAWLAGTMRGDNGFCPNARTLFKLAESSRGVHHTYRPTPPR